MSDQVLSKPTGSCDSSAEPLDLSTTSKVYPFSHPITPERDPSPPYRDKARRKQSVLQTQMSTDFICEPPRIITQPKEIWHYRNIKELAKKHHPLLAGEGPQRTPIRVTVSVESFSWTLLTNLSLRRLGTETMGYAAVPWHSRGDRRWRATSVQSDCSSENKSEHRWHYARQQSGWLEVRWLQPVWPRAFSHKKHLLTNQSYRAHHTMQRVSRIIWIRLPLLRLVVHLAWEFICSISIRTNPSPRIWSNLDSFVCAD